MKRLVAAGAAAVVVVCLVYLLMARDDGDAISGLAPAGDTPFGDGETLEGAFRGLFSSTGSRLAVFTDEGLGLAQRGEVLAITARGSNVVDAAWFANAATLLVAEGPVPTGALAVIDVDGDIRGTIPLEPSIGFGTGYGLIVAPDNRSAVVTAVERPPLAPEERRLVKVDLETGATVGLTPPGGAHEQRPFYIGRDRVAFTELGDGLAPRAMVLNMTTGSVEEIGAAMSVAGVIDGEPVLQDRRGRLFPAGRRSRILATIPKGTGVSSIDPSGGVAVVVESATAVDGSRSVRLRRIPLKSASPS